MLCDHPLSEAHYLALIYKISWVSLKLFRTKTKSRVFISCLFLPVSFQQKGLLCNPHVCVSVVMSALRLKSEMVWRQSATIEGLSSLHFLMVLHFSVSFCDEYFQFGASLDKIHKINRCRALSVMRSDAELLSGPAEWHYAAPVACSAAVLQWGAWQSGSGKGSPSDLWSQVPVWQILCGDTGMGEQSFLAAAFNSLEPTYFLKLAAFYILNPRIHATSIKIVYILSLIFLMMTIIYRLECPWQLAQL